MLSKKRLLLAAALLTASLVPLASEDSLSVRIALQSVTQAGPPDLLDRQVLLTYPADPRVRLVGARFEHERYRDFHPYLRNENGVFVLLVSVPDEVATLTYRISVDGVWTYDRSNPSKIEDDYGVFFSTYSLEGRPAALPISPEIRPDGQVTFRYRGQPGRFVSLIGDFNRWDPYWEPMAEDQARPGLYQVTLRLSPGWHYYVFSVDGDRVIDALNVELAQDYEGFRVSTLVVPGQGAGGPAAEGLAPQPAKPARKRVSGFSLH